MNPWKDELDAIVAARHGGALAQTLPRLRALAARYPDVAEIHYQIAWTCDSNDASGDAIVISFMPDPSFDTAKLIALMQRSRTMRLAGPSRLRIDEKTATLEARLARLREVLRALR